MNKTCSKCGSNILKKGKLSGVAAVKSLNSKTGLGGSDLQVTFCSKCGTVIEMTVLDPDKIK
ncbi:hypothetical protein [Clostridium oceanicum]|uniref:Uncharacterized protein n=1 Tax=Clostridium oceanicum TaxID=1543 RepID=A0ABN1JBQ7_9CLOT